MAKFSAAQYLRGRKCIYCDNYNPYKLSDGRIKCKKCKAIYSAKKLKRDIEILHYFCLELSAKRASKELGFSYNTVSRRYDFFRKQIAYASDSSRKLKGELELDESYFGGKRKGKRGRGAYNKAIVFGILERNGTVYTKVVPDVSAETLMSEIREKTEKGSVFYTDCFKSYKSLKQYGKHLRVNKQYAFASGRNHINGLEGFWSYAKERFHKYHGINNENYPLYLKEMEFRYNHRNEDLYELLFKVIFREFGTDFN